MHAAHALPGNEWALEGCHRVNTDPCRCFENQNAEVWIGVSVLNKMTNLGRPEFEAVT